MRVQQIQPSQTFEAKPKYIPQEVSYYLNDLLRKMDGDTVKTSKGKDFINIKEVRSLTIPEKGSIKRGRFLAKRNEEGELVPYPEYTTMIEMGKSRIIVNNRTNRIIEYKKPFFSTWKSIYEKAYRLVISALADYHNVNRCKRVVHNRTVLSETGAAKAKTQLKPIFELIEKMTNL